MRDRDWLTLGLLAIGGYVVYRTWNAAGNAISTATAPLANAWVSLTSPAAPQVQGQILMPDGTTIPVGSVSPQWIGAALVFSYNGAQYQLYGHDSNGNYPAAPYLG